MKTQRPFIGVLFRCCNVYTRIYLNKAKTGYVGWCPRCCKRFEVKIDPRGTKGRFFEAY